MKKLTAGIFTVLMGLVSVNAADAAVASKGYVDNKVTALTATVESNKTAADATQDALDALEGVVGATAEDGLRKAVADNTTAIEGVAENVGSTTFTGATYVSEAADLTAAVTALDAAVKGVASGNLQLGADAVGTTAIQDGAVTAEKLAEAVKTSISEKQTASQVSTAITNALDKFSEDNKVDGLDGRLTTAEGEIDGLQTQLSETGTTGSAIKSLQTTVGDAQSGLVKGVADNTSAIEAINNTETGLLAQAKTYTDGEIEGLSLQTISKVPAACGTAGNYCVLTTNGTNFVWEVIVREGTELAEGDTGLYGQYPAQ